MPVATAAVARDDRSQLAKQAWNAPGFSAIRTRRKTSLCGIPLGKGSDSRKRTCLNIAHWAIAAGPPAPARIAIRAMTNTLTRGCWRLTVERGSSSSWKCRTISSKPVR